jgi:hypothetical protein
VLRRDIAGDAQLNGNVQVVLDHLIFNPTARFQVALQGQGLGVDRIEHQDDVIRGCMANVCGALDAVVDLRHIGLHGEIQHHQSAPATPIAL